VNQLVYSHHNLDHISAARTTNHNAPANGKISDPQPVEGKFINAVGAVEQRDTHGFRIRYHWDSWARERETDYSRNGLELKCR
jgi:hypothetical protein